MIDKRRTQVVKELLDPKNSNGVNIIHLGWLIDEFWGNLTLNVLIPESIKTYEFLIQNNYSEKNKFYFNDADDSLYYLEVNNNENIFVFVHTSQSLDYLYIYNNSTKDFHIRRIYRHWKDNSYRNAKELCGSLKKAINNADELISYCDDNNQHVSRPSIDYYKKKNFNLNYGDLRDPGYVLTLSGLQVRHGLPPRVDKSSLFLKDIEYVFMCSGYIAAVRDEE